MSNVKGMLRLKSQKKNLILIELESCPESLGVCPSATRECGAVRSGRCQPRQTQHAGVGALKAASTVAGARLSKATLASSSLF